jgi:hypothetical protein
VASRGTADCQPACQTLPSACRSIYMTPKVVALMPHQRWGHAFLACPTPERSSPRAAPRHDGDGKLKHTPPIGAGTSAAVFTAAICGCSRRFGSEPPRHLELRPTASLADGHDRCWRRHRGRVRAGSPVDYAVIRCEIVGPDYLRRGVDYSTCGCRRSGRHSRATRPPPGTASASESDVTFTRANVRLLTRAVPCGGVSRL